MIGASDDACDDECMSTMMSALSLTCLTCMESGQGLGCFPKSTASCTAQDVTTFLDIGEACPDTMTDQDACVQPYMSRISEGCAICVGQNPNDIAACFPEESDGQCDLADAKQMACAAGCNGNDACVTRSMSPISQTCLLCIAEHGSSADKHCFDAAAGVGDATCPGH